MSTTMMVDFEHMMRAQYDLQVALYGGKHPGESPDMRERTTYIKDMMLAALDELHEALDEVGWKPWASSRHVNRDAFLSELVDALQFVMNLMVAAGADAQEVSDQLYRKHLVNWQRLNGYTGLEKCKKCKRALDDPATRCTAARCVDE